MLLQSKPILKMKLPVDEWRHPFFYLAKNKWFDRFIYVCIVLNTIVLAFYWYDQPSNATSINTTINYVFASIFTLETVAKIIGYGRRFFWDRWNIFDLVIVLITVVGIILADSINITFGP
jgi:hypothetical protein